MYTPTHGPWCGARTYPVKCRYCGRDIFYYSCRCGCSVLFEQLGAPWPKHDCPNYHATTSLRMFQIDEQYASNVKIQCRDYHRQHYDIVRCDPLEKININDIGILREIIIRVNIYEKFQVNPSNIFAYKLLGSIRDNNVGQITVHAGDLSKENLKSYTVYIDTAFINEMGASKHIPVKCKIHSEKILSEIVIWKCDSLEILI